MTLVHASSVCETKTKTNLMITTTLYAKDAKNCLRIWQIKPCATGFTTTSGLYSGISTSKFTPVTAKSTRSLEQQIQLEIAAKIKKKVDSGFVKDADSAKKQTRTNSLGFYLPMLAKPNVSNYDKISSFVQIKYNGLRCLITQREGKKYAYSKSGIPFTTLQHILDEVDIEEGVTLDGELYHHGTHLQTINSWVKKKQANTAKVKFMCYDCISDDSFGDRLAFIQNLRKTDSIIVCPTWSITELNIVHKLEEVRNRGYEGLIIRQPAFGYQSGKRNRAMIKVKKFETCEVTVLSVSSTRDGWALFRCLSPWFTEFNLVAPGTIPEKKHILENSEEYIGKEVEIEYAELSKEKIPMQAVALHFREWE